MIVFTEMDGCTTYTENMVRFLLLLLYIRDPHTILHLKNTIGVDFLAHGLPLSFSFGPLRDNPGVYSNIQFGV